MADDATLYRLCSDAIAEAGADARVAPVLDERNAAPAANSVVAVYSLQSEDALDTLGPTVKYTDWQIELRCLSYDLLAEVDQILAAKLNREPRVTDVGSAFDLGEDDTATRPVYRRQRSVTFEPI